MKSYNKIRYGFSLIECLLVIGLLSGLSTLFFTGIHLFEKQQELLQIEQLFVSCMYLQQHAQITNQTQELIFDNTGHCYKFSNTITPLSKLEFGCFKNRLDIPHTVATTFKHNKIVFYPTGIISAGTIYIMNSKKTRMYAISSSVSSVSFLRKYKYDGAWKPYS